MGAAVSAGSAGARRLARAAALAALAALAAAPVRAQATGGVRVRLVLAEGVTLGEAERAACEVALDRRTLDATLGADLVFALADVPAGVHELALQVPEHAPFARRIEVRAGETLEVECALEAGIEVAGRVIDARGEAVLGVLVTVESAGPAGTTRRTLSAQGGTFRAAGLPAGRVTLVARRVGYDDGVLELGELAPAARRTDLELRLAPHATVAGIVLAVDGLPARGIAVLLEPEGGGAGASARTDDAGGFELPARGPGPFHVEARAQGPGGLAVASARDVRAGAALTLRLAPTAGVAVVVRDPAVRAATQCSVRDAAGRLATREFAGLEGVPPHVVVLGTATGHGVHGLEPGVYGIEVASADGSRAAWERIEVAAGERRILDVALAPATLLRARALDGGAEVRAELVVESATGLRRRLDEDPPVVDGTARSTLLPPGRYRLVAEHAGRRGTLEIVLDGEPEHDARVELR